MALKIDSGKNQSPYRRRKLSQSRGLILAKTTVLIVVDGKTEKQYFKRLETLNLFPNVRFKTVIGDEVNYKNIFKENFELEHKYIILDIDNCTHDHKTKAQRVRQLIESKSTNNITFYNNYSFETFILNHKKKFAMPINKKEEYDIAMFKLFGVKTWSKNKDENQILKVVNQIDDASFKQALKSIKGIENGNCFDNPSSNMNLLFDKIDQIK